MNSKKKFNNKHKTCSWNCICCLCIKINKLFTPGDPQVKIQREFEGIKYLASDVYALPFIFSSYWKTITIFMNDLVKQPTTFNLKTIICNINRINKRLNFNEFENLDMALTEMFGSRVLDFITKMAQSVLSTPKVFYKSKKTLFFLQDKAQELSLTRKEVYCLLSNMFFGTLIAQEKDNFPSDYIFQRLYSQNAKRRASNFQKLKCLLNYFKNFDLYSTENSVIKITRKSHDPQSLMFKEEMWLQAQQVIKPIKILQKERIENFSETIQVDFANKYIGGGVLGDGCLQEEITLITSPESLVSLLFCAKMERTEAITIQGANIYSEYEGYADTFKFKESFKKLPIERKGPIVAIDAIDYSKANPDTQFSKEQVLRELNKAFVGFMDEKNAQETVTTGLWGCGGFRGDKEVKFIVQALAVARSNNKMNFIDDFKSPIPMIEVLAQCIEGRTVGQVFEYFFMALKNRSSYSTSLFEILVNNLPYAKANDTKFENQKDKNFGELNFKNHPDKVKFESSLEDKTYTHENQKEFKRSFDKQDAHYVNNQNTRNNMLFDDGKDMGDPRYKFNYHDNNNDCKTSINNNGLFESNHNNPIQLDSKHNNPNHYNFMNNESSTYFDPANVKDDDDDCNKQKVDKTYPWNASRAIK